MSSSVTITPPECTAIDCLQAAAVEKI